MPTFGSWRLRARNAGDSRDADEGGRVFEGREGGIVETRPTGRVVSAGRAGGRDWTGGRDICRRAGADERRFRGVAGEGFIERVPMIAVMERTRILKTLG